MTDRITTADLHMEQSNLEQFRKAKYATSTPSLKDLHNHVTPHFAVHYRLIGAKLGLPSGTLDIIKYDNCDKAESCCDAVLEKWLEVDPSATWEKLFEVIKSLEVTSKETGQISSLSDRVGKFYVEAPNRDDDDDDTWPPDQSHNFTPLLLVHHEGGQQRQALEIARIILKGDLTSEQLACTELYGHVPHVNKVTKDVKEILVPLQQSREPQFVMVEGAPGIGKSVLLREIAYRWGKQLLLQKFTLLLLLCLRNPIVQKATSISDLLLPFCKGDWRAKDIAATCSDCLFKNNGECILFLFDGFDEFPKHLQKCSLIRDIINRKILPLCGLIVSSRPHASVSLQQKATVKVNILGFTEEEQQHYIEQSLKGQPQSTENLTQYLQDHLAISNLCLVPSFLVILIFLYKMGVSLPNNSSKLYHHFICLTICRHLAKSHCPLKNDIKQLTDLPEPYGKIIKQLSKLALQALNNNQLVFSYEEIEAACPDIIATPDAINSFGLLQAMEHFGLTGKMMTFNFLHLTIQEYLAAHYIITDLHSDEEFCLLQKHFWNDFHINMFAIYIMLTEGQRSSFKKFISGGDNEIAISSEFLCDQLKCMRLFYCFREVQDDQRCKSIKEAAIFSKKEISLSGTFLSNTDLECVSLFLTSSSHKQWAWLDLDRCSICDSGLYILYKYLNRCAVTITKLWLDYNGLTQSSSFFISNIVRCCKIKELSINHNGTIAEGEVFYTIFTHDSSMLTKLYMTNTSLSSTAAKMLFKVVKKSNKLKVLDITNTGITDDVADDITEALTVNNSLEWLWLTKNLIREETIIRILQALKKNNTLQYLYVSDCSTAVKDRIRSIEHELNKERRSQQIQPLYVGHEWQYHCYDVTTIIQT